MGPAGEKELFEFYTQEINEWVRHLSSYKSKTDLGGFPGGKTIEQSLMKLQRLLSHDDSFDFFKQIITNKNDYLDLEEDYRDVHEFFSNQLTIWQQLKTAISNFDRNKQILDKNAKAATALTELKRIRDSDAPYNLLSKVTGLIDTVRKVNDAEVEAKRTHALERIDHKIMQLQQELKHSGIETPDLSNRLLRPLQQVKDDLQTQSSIPQIFMLQTQTADEHLDDGLEFLRNEIIKEQQRRLASEQALALSEQSKVEQSKTEQAAAASSSVQGINEKPTTLNQQESTSAPAMAAPATLVKPKKVAEVSITQVYDSVLSSAYIETPEQAEQFISELKQQLDAAIREGSRVRIK